MHRKVANSLLVCSNILQTATTMSLADKSSMFASTTHLWLDGVPRDKVGDDGKTSTLRAWVVQPGFVPPAGAPVPPHAKGESQLVARGLRARCLS